MKTKLITNLILLIILLTSCTAPKYVPRAEEIDINPYGSYIEVTKTNKNVLKGELIAIDSNGLIILLSEEKGTQIMNIPMSKVESFLLTYAQPKNYGWTIPLFTITTPFIHGAYSVLTFPIGLVVTSIVSTGGVRSFQYNGNNITYEMLNMFARFPQGIPPNIDIATIK